MRPIDYMPTARELLARPDDLEPHERDQLAAASDDAERFFYGEIVPTLTARAGFGPTSSRPRNARDLAFALAVQAALDRRARLRCSHVQGGPRPLIGDLTTGVMGCRACLPALTARAIKTWTDDGRCDVCDQPADGFTPAVVTVGPLTVAMHLCDDCFEDSGSTPSPSPPPPPPRKRTQRRAARRRRA